LRDSRNMRSYVLTVESELAIGYHWVNFDFTAGLIFQNPNFEFIYEYIVVHDMNDSAQEVYYKEFYGQTTNNYSFSDLLTGSGEKISYLDGNTTDWINDMGNYTELVFRIGFNIQYSSSYRFYLFMEDGYGTAWEISVEMYFSSGVNWIEFIYPSTQLIPSQWSEHGGGPFYLKYLLIGDTYSSSLDWYEIDFYQTKSYTPEDFGEIAERLRYTYNFHDYVDYSGEPRLMFEFEFEVYKPGNYYGELIIRDSRGLTWTSSWQNYLSSGYLYVGWFVIPTKGILDSGFAGSNFIFERLAIYEQVTNQEVFSDNDFQSTGYYSRSDLEAKLLLTNWHEVIEEGQNGIKGLVFYFEFEVNYQSFIRAELTIRDTDGRIWNGDNELYLYAGTQVINVPFWSDYLFSDPNFQVVLEISDLGTTRYYDRSEFDLEPSITFGVQVGDYLELHFDTLVCDDDSHSLIGSMLVSNSFNLSVYQNDIVKFTITGIENENTIVYAEVHYNGELLGEISIYRSVTDSYYKFLLLSQEDLANIHDLFTGYIVNEDSDYYVVNIDNEEGHQIIRYDKTSGFLSYISVYNYTNGYIQIDQMEITSAFSASGPGETSTSTGITFSTPAFELIVVLLAIPALLSFRRKRK
ncbi:MAG: hypothetical protein ACTSP4_06750, partial [Candidatus Hodarchaeales archaeon]